jgi:hypothetical protein
MPHARPLVLAAASTLALLLATVSASAQEHSIIRAPGDHPHYVFEAEPHLVLGFGGPFHDRGDGEVGIGFRGTFHIADGFVKSINDSVGVGVGIDFDGNGDAVVPVVLQWNFWLSTHWSVFGEPGLSFGSGPRNEVEPALFLGGRYNFNDRIALTMRVGYPDFAIGCSFFL